MRIQAFHRVVALFTILSLLLVACSGGGGTGPASSPASSGGNVTSSSPANAAPKGEFRVNLAGEPKSIDPHKANFANETGIAIALFEGLLGYDKDLKVAPALATEIPTAANGGISADALTYTFKLRDGLKWSDGKALSAKEIEYGVKRMLDPRTAGPYASFYFDIKNAQKFNGALGTKDKPVQLTDGQISELRDQVGVKAPDDKTVVFTLERPRFSFVQLAGLWPLFPVRQDLIEAKGDAWTEAGTLIGNGPWKLSEWVHNDHITMVPNENYWGPKPKLAKVVWKMIADEGAAYAAYQNNEIDLISVPIANRKLVLADPNVKNQLVRYNELTTFAFQMNNKQAPFDNVKVRQAFAMGFDRNALINDLEQGIGRPALSWVPPGMPGFDANAGKQYEFNPAKAKQLLAEAGFPDGKGLPEIKFSFADAQANKQRAEWFQAQFKQNLGVDIKLDALETKAYSAAYTANQLQSFWTGWGADYPDPDNWLPDILGTGKSANHTLFSDPQFDDIVKKALAEPDDAKREQLWKDAQNRMLDLAPLAPVVYRERLWLIKPQFKGFQTTAKDQVPGNRFYHLMSVD